MGVHHMSLSDFKMQMPDDLTLIAIKLRQRPKLIDDSVVITAACEDQKQVVFEVTRIDSDCECIFRAVEGPDNGKSRDFNLVLPKRMSVSSKVIMKCFKRRDNFARLLPSWKVVPTNFGAYRVVKMLMEHCCKLPGITTGDKDILTKGLIELEKNCLLLKVGDIVGFFSEHETVVSVDLMERPVDTVAIFVNNPPGKIPMHFLVVLTFNSGISIVVEKIKKPYCKSNVGIGRLVGWEKVTLRMPSIKLIGVKVQIQHLENIMKGLDKEYSMCCSNCWEFSSDFVKAVVKLLIDNAADSADKHELNLGLGNIIKVERPSPYMCFRLFAHWLVFDDKNNDTQRRLVNRLEDHLKNCPDCCYHSKLLKALKLRTKIQDINEFRKHYLLWSTIFNLK